MEKKEAKNCRKISAVVYAILLEQISDIYDNSNDQSIIISELFVKEQAKALSVLFAPLYPVSHLYFPYRSGYRQNALLRACNKQERITFYFRHIYGKTLMFYKGKA